MAFTVSPNGVDLDAVPPGGTISISLSVTQDEVNAVDPWPQLELPWEFDTRVSGVAQEKGTLDKNAYFFTSLPTSLAAGSIAYVVGNEIPSTKATALTSGYVLDVFVCTKIPTVKTVGGSGGTPPVTEKQDTTYILEPGAAFEDTGIWSPDTDGLGTAVRIDFNIRRKMITEE